jgi:hypothetical protein
MRVEFMAVYDDHTWDTVVVTVPDFLTHQDNPNREVLNKWANDNLGVQCQYRNVAFFSTYCAPYVADEMDEHALLNVGEGDECPLCENGTVGHQADGLRVMFAACRGECGESIELPPFVCPKCRTQFESTLGNAPVRTNIQDYGWCLDCAEKGGSPFYKIWVTVEENIPELGHHTDMEAYDVGRFKNEDPAARFAELLSRAGRGVYDVMTHTIRGADDPKYKSALECWDLVSGMLEDPHWRGVLDEHAPNLVAEALRIFEEKNDG